MAKRSETERRNGKAWLSAAKAKKSKEEGKKMLICEGYKMFKGTMRFLAKLPGSQDRLYTGTWLYRPDNRMWYLNGCPDYPFGTSFHEERVQFVEEVG